MTADTFRDRHHAGRVLTQALAPYANRSDVSVLALPRGGVRVLNDDVIRGLGLDEAAIDMVTRLEQRELERREREYRSDHRSPPELRGRTAILVDDGLATGATMLAAVKALRLQQPSRIVVAVPTAAAETCAQLRSEADEVICATTPRPFRGVGQWYLDFSQTSDDEVRELLARSRDESPLPP
jgi:putative phosphoribosyl transferase